jgi:hypothetical protein
VPIPAIRCKVLVLKSFLLSLQESCGRSAHSRKIDFKTSKLPLLSGAKKNKRFEDLKD